MASDGRDFGTLHILSTSVATTTRTQSGARTSRDTFPVGGERCNPLTISDGFSRYLLCCKSLKRTITEPVRRTFGHVFREFGLPDAIRTDNGPPFSSLAPGGLSRLAVWWIRLGIRAERIMPGRPDQNGRHERMHLTLKAETASPPRSSFRAQQNAFDSFRREYNQERPHEALGYDTPASHYQPSVRPFPNRLPELEYPPRTFESNVLSTTESSALTAVQFYISSCVDEEYIGLEQSMMDAGRSTSGLLRSESSMPVAPSLSAIDASSASWCALMALSGDSTNEASPELESVVSRVGLPSALALGLCSWSACSSRGCLARDVTSKNVSPMSPVQSVTHEGGCSIGSEHNRPSDQSGGQVHAGATHACWTTNRPRASDYLLARDGLFRSGCLLFVEQDLVRPSDDSTLSSVPLSTMECSWVSCFPGRSRRG